MNARIIESDGEAGIQTDNGLVYGVPVVVETSEGTIIRHGSITREYEGLEWRDAVDAFYDEYPVKDGGFGIG